jgi:uncharacterized protein YoxC
MMELLNLGLISVAVALAAGLEIKLTKLQKTVDEVRRLLDKSDNQTSN